MKKAKVSNGVVRQVWPRVKTLPDGTKITKNIPPHYIAKKFDCIIDVPDNVKVGFVWNGSEYAPAPKLEPKVRNDTILAILCERLGISLEDIYQEAVERKLAIPDKAD
jgi:hypothetical protein